MRQNKSQMPAKIPVSVVVATKNEESRIADCLAALTAFDEVWVVDSASTDRTQELAGLQGAKTVNFIWNGQYPKKRQWCLDHLPLAHDWVFFVDADESVPPALVEEIAAWDDTKAGYFIKSRYVFEGRVLRHGLCNKKLALFDRRKMGFPVLDDLALEGMGEIEGHYQPILRDGFLGEAIGILRNTMIHDAYEDGPAWTARHMRYARWEFGMNKNQLWPRDPDPVRQGLKACFRALPFRGMMAFLHSYLIKGGFRDGGAGYRFAKTRAQYYRMIQDSGSSLTK